MRATGIVPIVGIGTGLPTTTGRGFLSNPEVFHMPWYTCHTTTVRIQNIAGSHTEKCTEIGGHGREKNTGKATIGEGVKWKGIDTMESHLDLKVIDTSTDVIMASIVKEVENGIDGSSNIV